MSDPHDHGVVVARATPPENMKTTDAVEALHRRLQQIETYLGDGGQLAAILNQQGTNTRRLQDQVTYLAQARAVAELQLERNTRASALDMAIKALPESQRDTEAIISYAGAFLSWLKQEVN